MRPQTVVVTGSNGWIGRNIAASLSDREYETVGLSRGKPQNRVADTYISTDLLDTGNVYGALGKVNPDAIIHMGTLPNAKQHTGYETYESTVRTSYNLLEAATALDIETVVLPSSINAMGASFQDERIELDYLPVDERHRLTPRDPYGMAKHAMEVTADGFGRRSDGPETICSLRFPWVAGDDQLRERFVEADRSVDALDASDAFLGPNVLFSYLHVDDAVTITERCLEAVVDGHERFWAVAADTNATAPTDRLVERFYADVELHTNFSGYEALISTEKAREVLDWEPRHSWRDS